MYGLKKYTNRPNSSFNLSQTTPIPVKGYPKIALILRLYQNEDYRPPKVWKIKKAGFDKKMITRNGFPLRCMSIPFLQSDHPNVLQNDHDYGHAPDRGEATASRQIQ